MPSLFVLPFTHGTNGIGVKERNKRHNKKNKDNEMKHE